MNALFELVGSTISKKEYDVLLKNGTDFSNYSCVEELPRYRGVGHYVKLTPLYGTTAIKEFLNKIKFAKIAFEPNFNEFEEFFLPSNRTEEQEKDFINFLDREYDNDYGAQHLFGIIVFKDNSWVERHEYDGSEWWETKVVPKEEDYKP